MRHSTRPTSAGQLYSELYHKRVDTRPVGTTAQLVCTGLKAAGWGLPMIRIGVKRLPTAFSY